MNWDFSAWVHAIASRQKVLGRLVNLRNGHLKHRCEWITEVDGLLK